MQNQQLQGLQISVWRGAPRGAQASAGERRSLSPQELHRRAISALRVSPQFPQKPKQSHFDSASSKSLDFWYIVSVPHKHHKMLAQEIKLFMEIPVAQHDWAASDSVLVE